MTHVILENLTRRFGDVVAVDNLNLEIISGELVAFLGPSGCGKTTTLRMVTGLLEPTSGDVRFDDRSVLAVPTEKRGAVMVFQKHLLFPTMTVAQNVGFGLRMQGVGKREVARRVDEMLERVRLSGYQNRQPHELSGGQQQRIALARALIVRPKLLLLDEPLANLDTNLRLEMRDLIRTIQSDLQITTVFVTHDQEEAVMLADRVALMFAGVLQQYDLPQAFYQQPKTPDVAQFFRNTNRLPGHKEGEWVETALGKLRVTPKPGLPPDGPVTLTIRPEEIQLSPTKADNLITVPLTQLVYMGTHTQLQLQVGEQIWQAHGNADLVAALGEPCGVRLPPARIWLWPGRL